MKIIMMTDIEGVAGVASFDLDTLPESPNYATSKRLLSEEVNAAVSGLVTGGATGVTVIDGHGPGGLEYELIKPPARVLHGKPFVPFKSLKSIFQRHDAAVMIGQHAMNGVIDGNMNHTQDGRSIDYLKLNGRLIGEIGQFAYFCGALGLPLIMLAGDEAACREVRELAPNVVTASVKEGVGRSVALSMTVDEARKTACEAAEAAARAWKKGDMKPLTLGGPFVLEKRVLQSDVADRLMDCPIAERLDAQTVRYRHDELTEILYI